MAGETGGQAKLTKDMSETVNSIRFDKFIIPNHFKIVCVVFFSTPISQIDMLCKRVLNNIQNTSPVRVKLNGLVKLINTYHLVKCSLVVNAL